MLALQTEIRELLALALDTSDQHDAEVARRDEMHLGEMERRDELHIAEVLRRDDLHSHELDLLRTALETRDVIGQAKGVIMGTMGCTPDEAFRLLSKQSQVENRKLIDVAIEIAARARRRGPGSPVVG